ncbi:hypothetical protein L2E82_48750 [Cichorium intybus]|uniref:Uncharacterized protein n=1 Tax=Cichorium intybus TaxID=13427 RepID=A0ACB8YZZ7_CICIN|nr:hypothetical protein L2E82_48750 [Cichorium intybus]
MPAVSQPSSARKSTKSETIDEGTGEKENNAMELLSHDLEFIETKSPSSEPCAVINLDSVKISWKILLQILRQWHKHIALLYCSLYQSWHFPLATSPWINKMDPYLSLDEDMRLQEEKLNMKTQISEGFSPDDEFPLGPPLFMDTPLLCSLIAQTYFQAFDELSLKFIDHRAYV